MKCPFCKGEMVELGTMTLDPPIEGVGPGTMWTCPRQHPQQPCDVCGTLVTVNAISPSECLCSDECAAKYHG